MEEEESAGRAEPHGGSWDLGEGGGAGFGLRGPGGGCRGLCRALGGGEGGLEKNRQHRIGYESPSGGC